MSDKIKDIFSSEGGINRTIEKVITYGADQEERLAKEIGEYVVTESMEMQFEKLLTSMERAMSEGGANEIGVWVSGFYGSGKSSFTKYIGLALDERVTVHGVPFRQLLADRFSKPTTKALLNTVAQKHSAAVVMLDLASEMLAGATMEDVSSVLFYKVLQWAGYSQNLKVAWFERKLELDGKDAEFAQMVKEEYDIEWDAESKNSPLVYDTVVPELAHKLYPNLYKTPESFSTSTSEIKQFENERVKEMLEIVRRKSGKEYAIFVIDEVGQYVGSRSSLILNLDGLAKNVKQIGDGKAWIIGTAQQTLTEDDARAALNSPELYKLGARFPISVALESSDIKEICYKRLLSKSPTGQQALESLFDRCGQALRHNTKLTDARQFGSDLDKETFAKLYPFLPAHFEILLVMLGALAKSTGGVGLRSAIKIIQDILVESRHGEAPVCEREVGWLATMVTLFDTLALDIPRAFPSLDAAVKKAVARFPDTPLNHDVAKTVAVLQMIGEGNIPATPQNVAALLQASVEGGPTAEDVRKAAGEMMDDSVVPFAEKDGQYYFYSDTLKNIDREKAEIVARAVEIRKILCTALRDVFSPLPSARIFNSLTVKAGLKYSVNGNAFPIEGDRETVQLIAEYAKAADFEKRRAEVVEESRQHLAQANLYLLGYESDDFERMALEIYRSEEIGNRHKNDAEEDVKKYLASQRDRAAGLRQELQRALRKALSDGSFVSQGQVVAVNVHDADVVKAVEKELSEMGKRLYDRYPEAPGSAETQLAEKFLRAAAQGLNHVTTTVDPLSLVKMVNGNHAIDSDAKALQSIRDFLCERGSVEGQRLQESFNAVPYGWSKDMVRYLVAALLVAGDIKLRVFGREILINGQQAIDALSSNMKFRSVGVDLRLNRPSIELLGKAAERLGELIGEVVIPLEDTIGKTCLKHFPGFQQKFGPLQEKLETLGLDGAADVAAVNHDLADLMANDASSAPQKLGGENSELYEGLKWGLEVDQAFRNGLEQTLREIFGLKEEAESLPEEGVPGELRKNALETYGGIAPYLSGKDFVTHTTEFNVCLTTLRAQTADAVEKLIAELKARRDAVVQDLPRCEGWEELTLPEQQNVSEQIAAIVIEADGDISGLKKLLSTAYQLQNQVDAAKKHVLDTAKIRREARIKAAAEEAKKAGKTKLEKTVRVPKKITASAAIDALMAQLKAAREEAAAYRELELSIELED